MFQLSVPPGVCHVWQSLTSTSRVRITVSIWPTSGTVATSLPHSLSVFRASALTFRFTSPVCTQTCYRLSLHFHFLHTEVKEAHSLSSLFLHPLLPVFSFLPPCFLSYLPLLIPICCLIMLPLPRTSQSPAPSFLSFTAHNPSHGGQVQITPRGRGFWVFRQRHYLTC